MDYNLAALKLLCIQLKSARRTHDSSQSSLSLGPILFQRAWLQGVIISLPSSTTAGDGRFLVDDGTGVVELAPSGQNLNRDWNLGAYVMIVGGCVIRDDNFPLIKFRFTKLSISLHFPIERPCGIWKSWRRTNSSISPQLKVHRQTFNGQFCHYTIYVQIAHVIGCSRYM
ncbi:uncharacterized protein [Rutidosis leptorrhynchoides]|uniref:uncharacterized protein isoform X1 n=1 Tax=Rutidosis leptorrhynchoides TaxID=125765 RepID=UPI003A996D79